MGRIPSTEKLFGLKGPNEKGSPKGAYLHAIEPYRGMPTLNILTLPVF